MSLRMGCLPVVWVLLIGTTREQHVKPAGPNLYRGWGDLPLFGPMKRDFAHVGSHLPTLTQAPLRS
jgi:hypothetical protein